MRKTLIAAVVGLGLTTCLTATANTYTPNDITQQGDSVTIGAATFAFADPKPTGTGFIDPFLREQVEQSGPEWGVNTSIKSQVMNDNPGSGSLTGTIWENKSPVNFTHDLAISSLVAVNNTYTFFCDVNQQKNATISLTTFNLYVSPTAYKDATSLNTFLGTATPVYAMNPKGGGKLNEVNATSNTGSGSGDMSVTIPSSLLAGGTYLYMVAAFGEAGSDFTANSGFEEWWTMSTTPNVAPDTASALSLLGMAITGIEIFRRKFRA